MSAISSGRSWGRAMPRAFIAAHAVTGDAALAGEELASRVGAPGQDVDRPVPGAGGGGDEIGQQVVQLGADEGGPLEALALHRFHHLRPVVPQRRGDEERRAELLEEVQARADPAPGAGDPVAVDAALLGAVPRADLRI